MNRPVRLRPLFALSLAALLGSVPLKAFAQDTMPGASAAAGGSSAGEMPADAGRPSWSGDLGTRSNLLGDIAGLRPALERYGLSFGLSETSEVLGNPNGGVKRGAIVEGLTQMSLGADLAKTVGLQGAMFNLSALQIHGTGLTFNDLHNLNVISSIEADPSTRLNEVWVQQSFWDGKVDIKIGQQSADLEFITSEYEDLFINSGFGWPTLPAIDLPSGGPAYPLATPGVRLRAKPTDRITTLIGLFDGSPAGLRPGDPQLNDPSGTNFDVSSGGLLIGEVQYASNKEKDAKGLSGVYKLGAWYNSNRFADPFFAGGGAPQPTGSSTMAPGRKRGDWSVYGTLDQLVYRPASDSDTGLGLTARAMGAPGDRNLVDLFVQGGATYKGLLDGRPNDTFGLAAEWAHIGHRARLGDAATALATQSFFPVRTSETAIEATYQAQIAPWWNVQPDLQYVIKPGGGLVDPNRPTRRIGDAAVLGIRSVVTF